jgi:hypothetical protein
MCPVYSVNYVTGLYLSLGLSPEGRGELQKETPLPLEGGEDEGEGV